MDKERKLPRARQTPILRKFSRVWEPLTIRSKGLCNKMRKTASIILAAGKGIRMKSDMPKALCELSGKPMVEFMIDAARGCGIHDIVVIGGHKIERLKEALRPHSLNIIEQRRLLGSADAVKEAEPHFRKFTGDILILYADTPLIKKATIRGLIKRHLSKKADLTLLTGITDKPKDYGRVFRDKNDIVCDIIEYRDVIQIPKIKNQKLKCRIQNGKATEINIGAYCFNSKRLFEGLHQIKMNRLKKEFYLTDIVSYFYKKGHVIASYTTADNSEMLGINHKEELIAAEGVLRRRKIDELLEKGVYIKDPNTTYVQQDVKVGEGTTLYPFIIIDRNVKIGRDCKVGPFTHLRSGTILKDDSEIGNFVEVVRSEIGSGSKAKHLTYLGDVVIGNKVNIGAGTITANYNGMKKNKTVIEDKAFIGSGTTIIAPVKIGRYAVTGAGSVLVKGRDVPPKTVVAGVPAKPLTSLRTEA